MSDSVMLWLTVAVLLFWAMGAYNRLVRCRSQGLQTFSVLAGHFNQHLLLVKTHVPAADALDPAALAAWGGFAAAADQFSASLRVVQTQPLNAPAMRALKTAFETLQLSRARVCEQAAAAAESTLAQDLAAQWAQVSVMTELARADFNRTVENYNLAIGQFPALLLAGLFGFKPAQMI